MVMTSSGVKVSVSVGEPATFDLAGYSSKSYLEIGELTTIPSFGANAALVTHSPLATGTVKKHKGFVDYGETTIEAAMDNDDLGQQIIIALNEGNIKDSDCTIRLDYPDEASRYFTGKIFAFNETVGSANNIIGISFDVKLNSPLIRFGGGDGTPASLVLSFETQNYLQEGQVLSFSDIITFSRSTTSTYFGREVDQFGNVTFPLKTAAIDEPCLAYDPATGESLGLQVFGSATNLLTYSEQFDNAVWVKTASTVTANATTAPDGTATADKLVENSTLANHRLEKVVTVSQGVFYSQSIFLKAAERTKARVRGFDDQVSLSLDLSSGEILSGSGDVYEHENGWYRVSITGSENENASTPVKVDILSSSGEVSYTGDGTSGIYIWGAQLEAGSIATPYIKTEASQVTRAADLASVNDLSGWYNQTQGSLLVSSKTNENSNISGLFELSNDLLDLRLTNNGSAQVNQGVNLRVIDSSADFRGNSKISISYSNEIKMSANSNQVLIGDASSLSSALSLEIGRIDNNPSLSAFGHIKTLAYYPAALSEQKLQELTR